MPRLRPRHALPLPVFTGLGVSDPYPSAVVPSLRGDTVGGLSGAGSYWARQHGYTESSGYISDALNCARCGGRLPVQR